MPNAPQDRDPLRRRTVEALTRFLEEERYDGRAVRLELLEYLAGFTHPEMDTDLIRVLYDSENERRSGRFAAVAAALSLPKGDRYDALRHHFSIRMKRGPLPPLTNESLALLWVGKGGACQYANPPSRMGGTS